MRISNQSGDIGYRLWRALWAAGRAGFIRVYFDGILQDNKVLLAADDDSGILIRAKKNPDGVHYVVTNEDYINSNYNVMEVLKGVVKIRLDPEE